MPKTRLETFSDAIIAIIMTILVLELVAPLEPTAQALWDMRWRFLIYALSFISLANYWNNHHHLLQIARKVNGAVLWSNLFLILCLSLFPFATAWVDEHLTELVPALTYGAVTLLADIAHALFTRTLIRANGPESDIARVLKGSRKSLVTILIVIIGMALGFAWPPLVVICCAVSASLWFVPEARIERFFEQKEKERVEVEEE